MIKQIPYPVHLLLLNNHHLLIKRKTLHVCLLLSENALLADEAGDDMETTDNKPDDAKDDADEVTEAEVKMEVNDSPTKEGQSRCILRERLPHSHTHTVVRTCAPHYSGMRIF